MPSLKIEGSNTWEEKKVNGDKLSRKEWLVDENA